MASMAAPVSLTGTTKAQALWNPKGVSAGISTTTSGPAGSRVSAIRKVVLNAADGAFQGGEAHLV